MDSVPQPISAFLESDDHIFHYTNLNTLFEFILPKESLQLSAFTKTNDPSEYKDLSWISAHSIQMSTSFNNAIKNDIKISCFVSLRQKPICPHKPPYKPSFGYLRSRMWSQYADGHRGVCLAFDKTVLKENAEKEYPDVVFWSGSVSYDSSFENSMNIFSLDVENESDCSNILKIHYSTLFFLKDNDYWGENEFRIVAYDRDENRGEDVNLYIPIRGALKAIILGDRFPMGYKPLFDHYSRNLDFRRGTLEWVDREPQIQGRKEESFREVSFE